MTQFLKHAEEQLRDRGRICAVVKDVENCFPKMPKEAIRIAMRSELRKITDAYGFDAVTVPKCRTRSCTFKPSKQGGMVRIPFEDLLDIMNFALDNTLMIGFDGQLWRQILGVPMGDPHSPGMTIGTCAWMEHEWLQTVHPETRGFFAAKRYMDDLLIFYAKNEQWDYNRLLGDLTDECYFPPLKLTDGSEGTFLETSFKITATNRIVHWLKNQNAHETCVWRYAHFASPTPFTQKRAVLMACLLKVDKMASDERWRLISAKQKLAEFARLQYPRRMLWTACTTMGVKTRHTAWFKVRDFMH